MYEDYAARALGAHQDDIRAKEAEAEAEEIRARRAAINAISIFAHERLGLPSYEPDVEKEGGEWKATAPLTPDASIRFSYRRDNHEVEAIVRPCDQLYYDFEPGIETRAQYAEAHPRHGVSYGCYGLDIDFMGVRSIEEVGRRLTKISDARARWTRKHCPDE